MNIAEDLVTENIACPGGMPAYSVRPRGDGPHPVVILMHERYGLVDHTRDLARRCARDGFLVLAPDFFFKHPDKPALNAGTSRYDLTDSEAVMYLKAAAAALKGNTHADIGKVAVAGYCQTGRYPLIFAAEVPIAAAIVWYGAAAKREWLVSEAQPRKLEDVIAAMRCPVFGAFGERDHIISIDDVRRFRDALEERRKTYEIHLYAGAPHGWLNDTMPGRYRKAQADAAWAAQQRFLAKVFARDTLGSIEWQFTAEFAPDYDFGKNKRLE
jgi:carboxymethylenebutenolidase